MNIPNYVKDFNLKEFIWDRYDPYGYNSISIEKVYKDIFLAVIGFVAITTWLYGMITFCRMFLNRSMCVSGTSFVIATLSLMCTVVLLVLGAMWLGFEAAEGNIKTWNKIMEYKLLKR